MSDRTEFRLLVLADPHVALSPRDIASVGASRSGGLGLELLRRAIDEATNRGGFNAIALMGDVLNDGCSPDAPDALDAVAQQLHQAAKDTPLLVVPGNHDGDPARLLRHLGTKAGGQEIEGYRFFVFTDGYGPGDICTRSTDQQHAFMKWAQPSTAPLIVLQHNPMNPVIDDTYPYMLSNRQAVIAYYANAGAVLSLSGHYHKGQPATTVDGVTYLTVPALCEGAFGYCMVTLRGREVSIETWYLKLPTIPALVDGHVHTEFAYCGKDTSADGAIDRARRIGLAGVRLVEHAPQLYCLREDFWRGRHVREPSLWKSRAHSRMGAFTAQMRPRRNDFVKIGLEIEVDGDGQVTLHDEDRWVDLLVGAVHFFKQDPQELSDAQMGRLFLWTCEKLIAGGAQVLAHPWRIFAWAKRRIPTELYAELAEMLAATHTAAEINFHGNWSDPAFFALCAEKGARIAFGSDAHQLREVGSFHPHLDVLRQAVGSDDPQVLARHLAAI